MATFIDLFAGAGGISEGFLAAGLEFLLASDINANCALTHEMRYNRQLGLPVRFVTGDVTEPGFTDRIAEALEGREVDVVAGGPSCQSFSTAGRRRRRDRRDTLFESYLAVIRRLKPRYFVMENVKGILTKDGGAVFRRITSAIRSIPDETRLPALREFASGLKGGAALAALVDKGGA